MKMFLNSQSEILGLELKKMFCQNFVSLTKLSIRMDLTQMELVIIFKKFSKYFKGIGLFISKKFLEELGPYPNFKIKSKVNEGSKFTFYIYH